MVMLQWMTGDTKPCYIFKADLFIVKNLFDYIGNMFPQEWKINILVNQRP